jgi:hypothetical protein
MPVISNTKTLKAGNLNGKDLQKILVGTQQVWPVTEVLFGSFTKIQNDVSPKSGYAYSPELFHIGQVKHTWSANHGQYFSIMYIDNISFWESGKNKIEILGVRGLFFNVNFWKNPTFGFIEYPPEEWIVSDPSPSYDVILSEIKAAKHSVGYPAATDSPFDISTIYEGPTAKTLVIYSDAVESGTETYRNVELGNAKIMINGGVLTYRQYPL